MAQMMSLIEGHCFTLLGSCAITALELRIEQSFALDGRRKSLSMAQIPGKKMVLQKHIQEVTGELPVMCSAGFRFGETLSLEVPC